MDDSGGAAISARESLTEEIDRARTELQKLKGSLNATGLVDLIDDADGDLQAILDQLRQSTLPAAADRAAAGITGLLASRSLPDNIERRLARVYSRYLSAGVHIVWGDYGDAVDSLRRSGESREYAGAELQLIAQAVGLPSFPGVRLQSPRLGTELQALLERRVLTATHQSTFALSSIDAGLLVPSLSARRRVRVEVDIGEPVTSDTVFHMTTVGVVRHEVAGERSALRFLDGPAESAIDVDSLIETRPVPAGRGYRCSLSALMEMGSRAAPPSPARDDGFPTAANAHRRSVRVQAHERVAGTNARRQLAWVDCGEQGLWLAELDYNSAATLDPSDVFVQLSPTTDVELRNRLRELVVGPVAPGDSSARGG